MKKLFIILLIMVFVNLGYNAKAEKMLRLDPQVPENSTLEKKIYIPIIVKAVESRLWELVQEGALKAAEDYGIEITFQGTARGAEVQKQLDLLEAELLNTPQAIILSALDARAVTPYLENALSRGIPVIGIDSGVDSPIVRTTVATDNYSAGALAADRMAELLGETGKVGLIVLDRTSRVGIDRADGFIETMRQKYPNIEVLPPKFGEGSLEMSRETARKMLIENPDMRGVFGANEDSTIGIVEAVEALNREDEVKIIGFDVGRVAQAVREGRVAGAIAQNPREMGYRAVETAYLAYLGQRLPEFIDTGFAWYDKNNIDTEEIQQLMGGSST